MEATEQLAMGATNEVLSRATFPGAILGIEIRLAEDFRQTGAARDAALGAING